MLLCLNSEWQGCESPQLESGARLLAGELFGESPYLDLGPAECDGFDMRNGVFALDCVVSRFRSVSRELEAAAPERIFTVGGTCGAEAAPVAYLARRYEDLGVLWLDAHGDLNTPASSPSGHFHGMVLRTLLGDGPADFAIGRPLDPHRVVIAGVRDLDAAEREYIEKTGVEVIAGWPADAAEQAEAFFLASGVRQLYVHVDVDVFDPDAFGDALFSVPGGPTLSAVSDSVRQLVGSFDLVGVGVVESCGRVPGAATELKEFLVDSDLWSASYTKSDAG